MARPVSGELPTVRKIRLDGLARRAASSTSAVLPMPAGPRTMMAAPASRSARRAAIRLCSASRPTSGPPRASPFAPVTIPEYRSITLSPDVRRCAVVDTAEPDGTGQPDEQPAEDAREAADAREYAQQLRAFPVDQVLRDFLFSLLNAAQVKLGRRDARLLIDVTAVAHEHARHHLPGELTGQIDEALAQLRMAQVSAENRAGQQGQPEENDLGTAPAPPSAGPGR